jgi:hypothetical protein
MGANRVGRARRGVCCRKYIQGHENAEVGMTPVQKQAMAYAEAYNIITAAGG